MSISSHGCPVSSLMNMYLGILRITLRLSGSTETPCCSLVKKETLLLIQMPSPSLSPVRPVACRSNTLGPFLFYSISLYCVVGSKLDMRRYVEGVEADQLECEIRRYSTAGIHVRWPAKSTEEYNRWFTCTLKHTKGLFIVTSFLRHPSAQPPTGQQDYRSWSSISDTEILITTGNNYNWYQYF